MQSRVARLGVQRIFQRTSAPTTSILPQQRHISTYPTKTTSTFTFGKPQHNNITRSSPSLQRPSTEPTFQLLNAQSHKKFSTEVAEDAAPQAVIENLVKAQAGFVSRALRTKAKAKYTNLPISPHKLRWMCKLIKGMNVREAIIQLRLCSKRKSYFLRRGIRTLTNSAVNTFNMTKDRLIVSELSVQRGVQHAKVEFRARGRAALRMSFRTHLYLTLAEQPYHAGEIRIGRYGRTIDSWKKFDKVSEAWKLKRAEENGI